MKLKFILRCLPERTKIRAFNYAEGFGIILKPNKSLGGHKNDTLYFTSNEVFNPKDSSFCKYILKQIG